MGKGRGTRKAELKKKGVYVNPRETWALDCTIAEFVLPRLKKFKKISLTYPGIGEADTPEKWDAILDKMILAFQYCIDCDEWCEGDPKYDTYLVVEKMGELNDNAGLKNVFCSDEYKMVNDNYKKEMQRREDAISEGLQLFAKWYRHLGW